MTEIITYAPTTPEKAVEFTIHQATNRAHVANQDRSVLRQNMVSGIFDTVALQCRSCKNKYLALAIGKVFEQTGNPKEDLPNEINSFAFALTGLVAEKTSKLSCSSWLLLCQGNLKSSLPRLGLEVTYTATLKC